MALSDSFIEIFDKSIERGNAQKFNNGWVVEEHEGDATMTQLNINAQGRFLGFNHDLVKGVKDNTTKMSSILEDKDCDGIAFLTDNSQQEHLIFAELKSNFDINKIACAFHQITMSFIKMHAWLSLCKHYNLENLKIHFIVACKCYKNEEQEENIMHRISETQQLERKCFESKFLSPLLKKHNIKVKLSSFKDIEKRPFHDNINNKEITMYLQLTERPTHSQTAVSLT